jgi:adenosylmethionine-8-amino-7-oxononanoate aminotransferase
MPYAQMQTAPRPIPVVRTEGVHLILDDGRCLIDGMASWWTACHGYNHPHMVQAVASQLERMPHVMFGGIHHPQALRLARRLAELLPGDLSHVFFCDSGSVAVEVALKMAVQSELNRGSVGRTRFVCFRHAYHGDTAGAMSVCDPDNSMHAHFKGYLLQQYPCDIPESHAQVQAFEQFLDRHRASLAGVIIEPLVQGAGGMKFHSPQALAQIHQACRRRDLLLIADEIATGFGRTGTMFACQQAEVVPDIICLGKALSGGMLSFAATVATQGVYNAFLSDDPQFALMHGPTYMANPLACAAANASLDLFEQEPRVEQARQMQAQLEAALAACRGLPGVVDVRCRGAIGVIQVAQLHHLEQLRSRFVECGIWLRPFRDMIYLTPPLNIAPAVLQHLLDITVRVVREWSKM